MTAYDTGEFSEDVLGEYERSWRSALGREFSTMLSVRRFMNKVSDERMDNLFSSMKRAGLEPTLEGLVEEGDMDMQSGVLRSALTDPGMIRVLAGSLGRMAFSELRQFFNL
jgi:flavin-dependent dehydrogenase